MPVTAERCLEELHLQLLALDGWTMCSRVPRWQNSRWPMVEV